MIQDRLLSHLNTGAWAIELLAPAYRSRLQKELQSKNESLTLLTASRYLNSDLSQIQNQQSTHFKYLLKTDSNSKNLSKVFEKFGSNVSIGELTSEDLARLNEAFEIIKTADKNLYLMLLNNYTSIALFEGVPFRTASDPCCHGMLFLGIAFRNLSAQELSISLVHEAAHQELFIINLLDRLVAEGQDYRLAHAPFQGVERPPIGRIHSYHALYRMIQYCKTIGRNSDDFQKKFFATFETLFESDFTPFALKLASICKNRI